ncbi:cilia- and flagella-associated protein 65 [Cheilinus undulatus]|uniref:cilia- and flagella-associated protein 65 n=1 Tax=Cheilinus undulatus TaxID=241271 RepID=UPI001BD470BC|nr:cilia- and flagella-associated protein 65 [Cheilinus undulatus]
MLAEARGPEQLGSRARWEPTSAGRKNEAQFLQHPTQQDTGIIQQQLAGNHHRKVSSQKSCFLGLEVKTELIWEDWCLQKEFTKTVVLKNIHSKLQKLHVRPPVSKFFTTLIPQTIFLSPGTSFSVPVTFKPLQRCEYEDCLEFYCNDGSFRVHLRATIPCPALEVPDSVLLPLSAVRNSAHTTFLLRNVSKLQTYFQWECAAPFHLSPEQGMMKPGQECQITVVFQPQEAQVYQQQAYCRFGEEEDQTESCCIVILQGLAKYPYLQLRTPDNTDDKDQGGPKLPFGSVAIGRSLQKIFEIFNPSPVHASFHLSLLSDDVPLLGSEFSYDQMSGELSPGGSCQVTVTYTPTMADVVSVEYLALKCDGALCETLLKLTGNSKGPEVSLSSSVLDFGCVEEGEKVVLTLELFNSSPTEAIYQWDLDCSGHSVFSIQPACGTVLPHSYLTLKAAYKPTQPFAHHRRVACLILHKEPVFLDLIGTCHSELQKPAVLKPEHLVLYKLNWNRRQDQTDPFSAIQQDDNVHLGQEGVLSPLNDQSHQRPDSDGVLSRTPMDEYFLSCFGGVDPVSSSSSLKPPHVSVVPTKLLFNHKVSSSFSTSYTSSQSVSITNHTRGKLSLVWTLAQDSPFSVSPSLCDLAPLKSTSFRVNFDPKLLYTLHEAQLECFAYNKESHYLEGQLLCPPWSVTVRVIGHSFQPGTQHFIPCCSLKPPRVIFPALNVLSYRTVLLQNSGDLPLTFSMDRSSDPGWTESVSIVPSCGLIQPWNHQILTLRATPTEDSPRQGFSLHLQLNASNHTKELAVSSVVEKPCVSLEGDGSLYFQPTAVGSRTQRSHHIRNLSCLPLQFKWSIPEQDQELLSVEPDAGELQPNESLVQIWSFSPLEEKAYTLKPALTFWPIQTPGSNKSHLDLKVVGVGAKGFIKAEKDVLDVGEILVGGYRSFEVPLVNRSPCPVSFCLSVQQTLLDEEPIHDPQSVPKALKLDCERGTIASNSTMLLQFTVRPHRRAQYQWIISYQTLNASGNVLCPPQAVCEVLAKGVYPTLQVTDVSSSGSAARLRKVHLWKLFSLDSLNEHLISNPSAAEVTYKTPTRHSFRPSPSTFTTTMLDFNFSAAPLDSDPSTFMLMFYNPGSLPVEWAFLFPEDQQIDIEYWAETGEFSSTDLYQMKVKENRLFSVSPRSGSLLPGQQRAVCFSYSHVFTGIDRFPVVFKISYGREILLNFQGVTVEPDIPYLHFVSKRHVFDSVTIGDCNPPRQGYELHNGGAVSVCYKVDSSQLSQLQVDNFNHPVLSCLNPEGEIPPGETTMLDWIFSPLEAKTYHMDIQIHVQHGDSTLVTFEGCGLNSPSMCPTKQFNCSDCRISESCVQRLPSPEQVVFLPEDSVSLGDIPVCSRSSKVLYLTNVSHTDTAHYTWDIQRSNQQVVMIDPERGILHPQETALCFLTFTSSDYPADYQLDVMCQVTREAELTQYEDALQHWEEEKERQQVEFTITDKNCAESQKVLIDEEPEPAPVRKAPLFRKYKTLPPISPRTSYEAVGTICTKITRAERRAQREKNKIWRRPKPPQPALLHLGITAHSHGLQDYITHFPDQFNEHYRCHQLILPQTPGTSSASTSSPPLLPSMTHSLVMDISMQVLNSVLRDILDDSAFTKSLLTMVSRPVTYLKLQETCQPPSSPSQTVSQPQTKVVQKEQYNLVDSQETARGLEKKPEIDNALHMSHVSADVSEGVLLDTLQTLMVEAVRGELILTVHPRNATLPPVSPRNMTSKATVEEERENRKEPTETSSRPHSQCLLFPVNRSPV